MNLTLDQVETLQAVVESGSFAAAARKLNKVQSAVSYDIRQMEERLGVNLFDRGGYRASLTQQGRVLFEEGLLLLSRARRMEALANRFREGWEARLEVVIDGVLPMEPVMLVLKKMAEEGVPTRMQIKMEFLGGVQYRFERDKADLMVTKAFTTGKSHRATPLPPVECVLVVSPEHTLAELMAQGRLTETALREFIQLSIHDSSESDGQKTETHLIGGSRVYYLSDFNTKRQALMLGLGYGWMPTYLVRDDLEEGTLVELKTELAPRFEFIPYLVHPIDRPLGKAGNRFLELLVEHLGAIK